MKKIFNILLIAFITFGLKAQSESSLCCPVKELPGGPENTAATLKSGPQNKSLILHYNGAPIFESTFVNQGEVASEVTGKEIIEQRIQLRFNKKTKVSAIVHGSKEALAAETRGNAQENFALVRTSHGLSNNLRNNAIYDRNFDWMLEAPEGTVIKSFRNIDGTTYFELSFEAKQAELIFRPRYYQKHKNLPYFQPWTYRVNKKSITGWCSWWAYFNDFTEEEHLKLLEIWEEKHFADYGYRYIQIDDGYQGENDRGRKNCEKAYGYHGGRPTTWLDWKKDLFPGGLTGYVKHTNSAGFNSGVWLGCFFSDVETMQNHPDWFVTDKSGNPFPAPWVSYAMDATHEEVIEALIRPTFKGLKNAEVEYVKIDQLRHFLYDNLHNNLEWCRQKGLRPDEVIRSYLRIAREELGEETFILACWGVLPEAIGLADACRIGGDGYGPVTMQQYNSWNGIVWRNDPDHCDVMPKKKGKDIGNVKETEEINAIAKESVIRPALASIAGAMLMLSDKPEVYAVNRNLVGLRRSSPVLFSVPGQLYDFDPKKTEWLRTHERTEIKSGGGSNPIDGDRNGYICPYWLNEFNTSYENWNVLHRLNWTQKGKETLPAATIYFSNLGLDASKEYLVYEFWANEMVGICKDHFKLDTLETYGIQSLAIREKLDRPQLISTNRHISQGAAEVEKLIWENNSLQGRSRVIVGDKYVITLFVPEKYKFSSATINGEKAETEQNGRILKIFFLPGQTGSVSWKVDFF